MSSINKLLLVCSFFHKMRYRLKNNFNKVYKNLTPECKTIFTLYFYGF